MRKIVSKRLKKMARYYSEKNNVSVARSYKLLKKLFKEKEINVKSI